LIFFLQIPIAKVISHQEYVPRFNHLKDIALVKLKIPASFDKHIALVCLPDQSLSEAIDDPGPTVTVIGWGRTVYYSNGEFKVPQRTCDLSKCIKVFFGQKCALENWCFERSVAKGRRLDRAKRCVSGKLD
jgi:hypothetical protein